MMGVFLRVMDKFQNVCCSLAFSNISAMMHGYLNGLQVFSQKKGKMQMIKPSELAFFSQTSDSLFPRIPS